MQLVRKDDAYEIWENNKLIGFLDENDILSGIHPATGYSVEICSIDHLSKATGKLKKWLSLQK